MKSIQDLRAEIEAKSVVVEVAAAEVADREKALAKRTGELETITKAIAAAEEAFHASSTDKTAVALSAAQHRHPRAKAAVDDAADALVSARAVHASASAELASASAELEGVERITELADKAAEFEKKAPVLAGRVVDLVERLREALLDVAAAHAASSDATATLCVLTGETEKANEVAFAAEVVSLLRAREFKVNERDLAALLPRDADHAIGPLATLIAHAVRAKEQRLDGLSAGELGELEGLLDALRGSRTLAEARHKVLIAAMGPRMAAPTELPPHTPLKRIGLLRAHGR